MLVAYVQRKKALDNLILNFLSIYRGATLSFSGKLPHFKIFHDQFFFSARRMLLSFVCYEPVVIKKLFKYTFILVA